MSESYKYNIYRLQGGKWFSQVHLEFTHTDLSTTENELARLEAVYPRGSFALVQGRILEWKAERE